MQEPGTLDAFCGSETRPERANPDCFSLPPAWAAVTLSAGLPDNSGVWLASGPQRALPSAHPAPSYLPTLSSPRAAGGGAGEERVAISFPQTKAAWDARVVRRIQHPLQGPRYRNLDPWVNLSRPGMDPDIACSGCFAPQFPFSDSILILIRSVPYLIFPKSSQSCLFHLSPSARICNMICPEHSASQYIVGWALVQHHVDCVLLWRARHCVSFISP